MAKTKRTKPTAARRRPKGEGALYQRESDGRWVYVVDVGRDKETGARRRRTFYGQTRAEVLRQAQDQKAKAGGTLRARSKDTIGEFVRTWLENDVLPTRAKSTYATYKAVLEKHVIGDADAPTDLARQRIDSFEPHDASALFARLHKAGVTSSVLDRAAVALHRAFRVRQQRTGAPNPFHRDRGVERPRYRPGEVKVLDPKQVRALLAAARKARDNRFAPLWELLVANGLRLGEGLGLQWGDVDFQARMLTVRRQLVEVDGEAEVTEPKTARSKRTIPLTAVALDALRRRQKTWKGEEHASAFCFTLAGGTHPRRSNLRRDSFEPLLAAAKLPHVTIHSLRHATATFLAADGVDVATIMQLLGQSRPGVTLAHYLHSSAEQQKRAIERLDGVLSGSRARARP